MKQLFLERSLGIIKNSYPQYNDDTLSEIKYGLEAFYLTITKTIFCCSTFTFIKGNFIFMYLF